MAITRYSTFDKTVNTIADRNAIQKKINHMTVVVKDAIADPSVGSGKAVYRWDEEDSVWVLVSKSTLETISFVTEEITIINSEAQLSNYPLNHNVWNAAVLDVTTVIAYLNLNNVTVSASKISGINSIYNNKTLRVTYAYGSVAIQIASAIEDSVDSSLFNNVKTINGIGIIGTGNIEVLATSDFTSLTSKPTTLSGYGITDAQSTLVSGTSIKTINGTSILGSGDIVTTQTTITGNAGTATKLATPRLINGVSFDGTANITITDSTKQNTLVSGTSIKTINGTSILGSGDIVTTQTTITGNAGTATKLATPRLINGVSFDGTADITITDSTKQNTLVSGTSIKTINGTSILGSGDIAVSAGAVAWNDILNKPNVVAINQTFIATAGQSSYTLNYTPGTLSIFVNGVKLSSSDFTASNGTSITFADALLLNSVVDILGNVGGDSMLVYNQVQVDTLVGDLTLLLDAINGESI